MMRNLESQSNPWGVPQAQRADWAEGSGVPIVNGAAPEYLYWVGCAGSFDERARDISRAVAELLQRAGVSFAILGPRELCTGDPARRMGNEFLFQTLAEENVETMNAVGVTKVIANCPHCFNTLRNEYPQYGGTYEVIHHTELLGRLVAEGRLQPDGAGRDAARLPRPLLPRPSQPGVRRPSRRPVQGSRPHDGRDAPPQGARPVLRSRRRTDVDGRAHRQAHQHRAHGRGGRDRRGDRRRGLPVLPDHARRRGEGPGRRNTRSSTSPRSSGAPSRTERPPSPSTARSAHPSPANGSSRGSFRPMKGLEPTAPTEGMATV